MSVTTRLTVASGAAVALAASALLPLYEGQGWVLRVGGAVLVVVLAGLAARSARLPRAVQPLITLLAAAYYLCQVFAGRSLAAGLLPTGRTVAALRLLVRQGQTDIARLGPPVPTHVGLVLLTTAGVAAVAVVVDLVAVVLDRAAVAGLPLLLLFAVPSAVLPGGLGWLPFGLGASGWLGLLLVEGSERVDRWGSPLRGAGRPGGDESGLGRVGRRIGAAAVGLAVVVPALVPGLDNRLVGGGTGPGSGDGKGGTVSTTYDPIAQLQDELTLPQPRQLLVYTTTDPHPDYLRMTTLDSYTGAGWTYTRFEADVSAARVQKGIPTPPGDSSPARQPATTRIGIDSLDVRWLPSPIGPTRADVQGRWLWDSGTQTIFSATRNTQDLPAYTITSSRALPDRTQLEAAADQPVDPGVERRYGQPLEVTPYVDALTARVVKGARTPYDRAVALQTFFRGAGFVYSLRPSTPTDLVPDQLEAFLRGKRGFCEQYATAMAVMLRVAGLPSRVAVGFTPGTPSRQKGTFSVTTSDAHAWPEAWFPGSGWIRFEPTPAESRSTVPGYTQAPTSPGAVTPQTPTSAAPLPAPKAAPGGRNPEQLLGRQQTRTGAGATSSSGGVPWWLLAVPVVLLVLTAPLLLTAVRRRQRLSRLDAGVAWAQLRDDAADVGHRWAEQHSPRTAAVRLAQDRHLTGPSAAALQRLAAAAELARYARPRGPAAPLAAPDAVGDPGSKGTGSEGSGSAPADLALLRHALQDGAPARVRLRARLLPPSTLRWAGAAAGGAVADVLDRSDELSSALARRLRRA